MKILDAVAFMLTLSYGRNGLWILVECQTRAHLNQQKMFREEVFNKMECPPNHK